MGVVILLAPCGGFVMKRGFSANQNWGLPSAVSNLATRASITITPCTKSIRIVETRRTPFSFTRIDAMRRDRQHALRTTALSPISCKPSSRDRHQRCPVARAGRVGPPRAFGRNPAECAAPPRRENQTSGCPAAARRAKPLAASGTAGRGGPRRPYRRRGGVNDRAAFWGAGCSFFSWARVFAGSSGHLPRAARPRGGLG